jgi:hypothetical protein
MTALYATHTKHTTDPFYDSVGYPRIIPCFDISPYKCITCQTNTSCYLLYECIHRPLPKDRIIFGYTGRKCQIKIYSCDSHRSHINDLMKNRIIISADLHSFREECLSILSTRKHAS